MENSTQFDLNEAIAQWRENLAQSPAVDSQDMEEMETHLRDSVAALQSTGLSAQEAFWVAKSRLGSPEQISSEFCKVNPQNLWFDRLFWMALGAVAIPSLRSIATTTDSLSVVAFHKFTGSSIGFGLVSLLVNLLFVAGVVYWVRKNAGQFRRLGICHDWIKLHPYTMLGSLLLCSMAIGVAPAVVMKFSKIGVLAQNHELQQIQVCAMTINGFVWPCFLGWLLIQKAKSLRRETAV